MHSCKSYAPLGVDFIKTSTGFSETGATIHAVQLIKQFSPENMGIKASGGIKTAAFAKELIAAGATRLGCSASVAIVKEDKLA
jgi:deoxyribose-phosphate aldolase